MALFSVLISSSKRKRWLIQTKMYIRYHAKFVLMFVAVMFFASWKIYQLASIKTSTIDLVEMNKCPACYGVTLCPSIHADEFELDKWSQYAVSRYFNGHNVFYATWGKEKVVLKKLAPESELKGLDKDICNQLALEDCDVARAIHKLADRYSDARDILSHGLVQKGGDILHCPSQRKMDFITSGVTRYSRGQHKKVMLDNILTLLLLNPEPLFLQAFPENDGWPFPKYHGACGRVIVEEYVGPTLTEFRNDKWHRRAHLAKNLLVIADKLTFNNLKFSIYLTDITTDNFAVDARGAVRVIDLENALLVDLEQITQDKQGNWDVPLESDGYDCDNCFSYSVPDLCTHQTADHNYYAICQGILADNSFSRIMPEGLLHDIPNDILELYPLLPAILQECGRPTMTGGRFNAAKQLSEILSKVSHW